MEMHPELPAHIQTLNPGLTMCPLSPLHSLVSFSFRFFASGPFAYAVVLSEILIRDYM